MTTTDERDERLGDLLDRTARRWDPPADLDRVLARERRHRAVRVGSALLAALVFAGAVGWALTLVRRDGVRPLGSIAGDGWTMQLPAGWQAQTIEACQGIDGSIGDGVIVTNTTFTFRDPDGGTPSCEDRFVFAGFPEDGVALSIEPVGLRHGLFPPHLIGTPFPLESRILTPTDSIAGGPSESYVPIWIGGKLEGFVRRWVGPGADRPTRDALDLALASIDVRAAAHWTSGSVAASGPGTVSFRFPDDWIVRDPTWPLWFVSTGADGAESCVWGDNPGDLGSYAGVLFVTDEVGQGGAPALPSADRAPMPEQLTWSNADLVENDARCGDDAVTRGVWRYALGGRDISVWLALGGPGVDETAARVAWMTAESLVFSEPLDDAGRWTETTDTTVTLHDEDDGFSVTYPPGWVPSEVRVNTWVSSPFEILALATYPLRPGGHAVTDGQVPSNAIEDLGPDDVFIWVNDGGEGGGFPPRPDRLDHAAVCGGVEGLCRDLEGRAVGIPHVRSWWFYFEDHGRGIYVFVAMGEDAFENPARSQAAWDVVNSMQFVPR